MFRNAVEIFQIWGFRIRIDSTWLLVAALIVWSLSASYFPAEVPGRPPMEYIVLGMAAMLLFFATLIAHELAHSLVARTFGIEVGSITLFMFGGVAELESEPVSAKSEFWIAIAGPVMSLALSAVFILLSSLLRGGGVSPSLIALTDYHGFINLMIAIFNLVPAFPLDGGRVLRAALWKLKDDLIGATRISSAFGSAFGFLLITTGVLSLLSSNAAAGLWQILIGFFVVAASRSSLQQLIMSETLKGETLASAMTSDLVTADADDTIFSIVQEKILRHHHTFIPIIGDETLLGHVDVELVSGLDNDNWTQICAGDIFVPVDETRTVALSEPLETVLQRMLSKNQRKLMVLDGGALVGVVTLSDLMRFMVLREKLVLRYPPKHGSWGRGQRRVSRVVLP
ncbi:MAG: site-2 protease family protein [Rhizobiaceae bacterium]